MDIPSYWCIICLCSRIRSSLPPPKYWWDAMAVHSNCWPLISYLYDPGYNALFCSTVSSLSNKFIPAIHIYSCIKCNLRTMLQRLLRLGSVGYGYSWSFMVGCKKKLLSWWRCSDSCHILVIKLVSGYQQLTHTG